MYKKYTIPIVVIILLLFKPKSSVNATSYPIYLTSPSNGVSISTTHIQFQWENENKYEEYVYMLCITDDIVEGTRYCEIPTSQKYMTLDIPNTNGGYIYWFVGYQRKSEYVQNIAKYPENPSFAFNQYSNIFVFGINRTIPYSARNSIAGKKPGDFFRPNAEVRNPDGTTTLVCKNKWVFKLPSQGFSPQDTAIQWNVNKELGSVLGATTYVPPDVMCKFNFIIEGNTTKTIKDFCRIYNLISVESKIDTSRSPNIVSIVGKYYDHIKIQIDVYECVKNFFNPFSWFKCQNRYVKSISLNYPLEKAFQIYNGDAVLPFTQDIVENGTFSLKTSVNSNSYSQIKLQTVFALKFPYYNISEEALSTYVLNPSVVENISTKPFSFPFNKIIGVTQWHGYTAFQSPHTGIDFGSYLENILASDNGIVVAKGYDTYYGECNSGGNYLIVRNSNGMYTVYFHLAQSYVNIGDSISKNQVIAQSGNSGKSECKPLGFHLHFETRKNRSQDTHDDPVKYVDVNWNLVPTIGAYTIPARLSGDNPHPNK